MILQSVNRRYRFGWYVDTPLPQQHQSQAMVLKSYFSLPRYLPGECIVALQTSLQTNWYPKEKRTDTFKFCLRSLWALVTVWYIIIFKQSGPPETFADNEQYFSTLHKRLNLSQNFDLILPIIGHNMTGKTAVGNIWQDIVKLMSAISDKI